MNRTHTRIAGTTAALLAAGAAGFSLRPSDRPSVAVADRTPAVEVRTKVIRRTIHIVRHEHPRQQRPAVLAGAAGAAVAAGTGTTAAGAGARPITSSTSRHATGSAAYAGTPGAVTTRSSSHGSAPASTGGSASAPVTTRTSSHGTSGTSASSGPITTRTSAGHGDEGGDGGESGGD